MQTFGKQLAAARTARGMTQEALAQAVNVTRSTVSSWERDRTQPDLDTLRRLSEVLEFDFLQGTNVPAPKEATARQAPTDAPARRPRTAWIIAVVAVLACACVAFGLSRHHRAAQEAAAVVAFNDYYSQQTAANADQSRIAFQNEVWEEQGDDAAFTHYNIVLREENGVAFDLQRLDVKLMSASSGHCREMSLSAADLQAGATETHVEPNGTISIEGGFPAGEFSRLGAEIHGVDAAGNEQIWYSLIEF